MPERIREATTGKMPTTICWWWRMKTISTHKQYFHIEAQEEFVASLVATDYKDPPTVTKIIGGGGSMDEQQSVVRRLTPVECERLQGMPDDWSRWGVNEKGEVYELSDSARYRLQGNGICTPFWRWLMKRISAQYERPATLGSLFDGQASFPMIWESINGVGSAVWSSEIERNAVAVAKYHFPEGAEDD